MKKLLLIICFSALVSCSYKQIIDTAGRSGTFDVNKAHEITNDIQHCKKVAKNNTSFVIMCYLNTVRKFGVDKFIKSIKNIVDGIIIVDLPFEEESEIKKALSKNNIHLIKLISPMTDKKRAQKLLKGSKGFIYYISATGITGSNKLDYKEINKNVKSLKKMSSIPVLVGFGIDSYQQIKSLNKVESIDLTFSALIIVFSLLK